MADPIARGPARSFGRRAVLAGGAAAVLYPALAAPIADGPVPPGQGATFGWAALDMATGRRSGVHRALALPMYSTFKWLLAACVLARVDAGRERLDWALSFGRDDLLDYAPVTRAALDAGGGTRAAMPVAALCAAAVTLSDNIAANLLLPTIGGPRGLTVWLRARGDGVTRLDRTEPALNLVAPVIPRDTTSAQAMLGDLARILYGDVLRPVSRERLLAWLLDYRNGGGAAARGAAGGVADRAQDGHLERFPLRLHRIGRSRLLICRGFRASR